MQTTTFEEEDKSGVHIGKMAVIPLKEPDAEEAYERVRRGIVKINAGGLYGGEKETGGIAKRNRTAVGRENESGTERKR